jgi:hypothetical protein
MPATYSYQRDSQTGLWQIMSRSGFILYESEYGDYVRQVCSELNAMSARSEKINGRNRERTPMTCGV